MSLPLIKAVRIADNVVSALREYCDRIEIAGSIRRQKPEVHDIDIVVLAHDAKGLKYRCREVCTIVASGGICFRIKTQQDMQIDIYFATEGKHELFDKIPSNWGSVMLCRTGSKDHNIYLAKLAKTKGLRWVPNRGLFTPDHELVASETEQDMFNALGLSYIEPQNREM